MGGMDLTELGFWGPPTSTVDWCEANYRVTRFCAEPFNTGSSLAMVLAGLWGWRAHRRTLEKRFLWAFALLSLVGLGSIAFHATLRFELQMADELPMLYLVLLVVFILLEDQRDRRYGRLLPAVLVGYAGLLPLLTALNRGTLQFLLFQVGFGSLELYSMVRLWWLQRQSALPEVRRLYRLGMGFYAGAVVAWFVDLKGCPWLDPNPQLHAVWHLGVSVGFYLLLLVMAVVRCERLGHSPRLRWRSGLLPQIVHHSTDD